MNSWGNLIKFHEKVHGDHANGKKGLESVKYIIGVFKDFDHQLLSHRHPIGTRLHRASIQDYQWIIQYARKIQILKSIKGSEELFLRLSKLDEVYQVLPEIEVALKLKLEGFDVSFIERNHQVKTPDILVKIGSSIYNVEVTTLNSPEINIHINDFYFMIFDTLSKFLRSIDFGGTIARPLKSEDIHPFLQLLKVKVKESLEKNQIIEVNEPGYFRIHIVPKQLQNRVPEGILNGFRFTMKEPRPVKDRIYNRIIEKREQLFYQNHPSILVVYCGTSCWEPETMFKDISHNINVVMDTYPDLMGIILTLHQRWWRSVELPVIQTLGNKKMIELAPAIQEYEASIIWENLSSKIRFPSEISQAYVNYQNNLKNL